MPDEILAFVGSRMFAHAKVDDEHEARTAAVALMKRNGTKQKPQADRVLYLPDGVWADRVTWLPDDLLA